jgi:hypothetical protein
VHRDEQIEIALCEPARCKVGAYDAVALDNRPRYRQHRDARLERLHACDVLVHSCGPSRTEEELGNDDDGQT